MILGLLINKNHLYGLFALIISHYNNVNRKIPNSITNHNYLLYF